MWRPGLAGQHGPDIDAVRRVGRQWNLGESGDGGKDIQRRGHGFDRTDISGSGACPGVEEAGKAAGKTGRGYTARFARARANFYFQFGEGGKDGKPPNRTAGSVTARVPRLHPLSVTRAAIPIALSRECLTGAPGLAQILASSFDSK